jgi:hypothetical protein
MMRAKRTGRRREHTFAQPIEYLWQGRQRFGRAQWVSLVPAAATTAVASRKIIRQALRPPVQRSPLALSAVRLQSAGPILKDGNATPPAGPRFEKHKMASRRRQTSPIYNSRALNNTQQLSEEQ